MENNNLTEYIRRSASKYISFAIFFAAIIILYPHNSGRIKLEFNRAKWRIQNVAHYRYQLKIGCNCSLVAKTPITIEVLDGEVVSIVDVDGKFVDWTGRNSQVFGRNRTMEGLFEQIQEKIYTIEYVRVQYDGKYGFPQLIIFDPEFYTIGDGAMYQISNFEVLP